MKWPWFSFLVAPSLVALILLASPAHAEDRPRTVPTRDVDVVYLMAGPTAPLAQRMRWGVTLGKLRVDPPSPGLFVIIDTATHEVQAVREGDRSVVQLDPAAAGPMLAPPGSYTRRGAARVAGLDCTQWETRDVAGRAVLACLTEDGVLLRVQADNLVIIEAAEVHFGPLGPQVFRIPADYRKIISQNVSRQRPQTVYP